MKIIKGYDAVKEARVIRNKVSRDIANMSKEELFEYLRQGVEEHRNFLQERKIKKSAK